jgi:branched-chain amino acid transport system ATP-binding protein
MSRAKILMLEESSRGPAPKFVNDFGAIAALLKESEATMLLVKQNTLLALKVADRLIILGARKITGSSALNPRKRMIES